MNVDITNHLVPWVLVKRMIHKAKHDAWAEGHKTPWEQRPDTCECNAWGSMECSCGKYGTGEIITPNPYAENQ